ncbi:MAG: CGP-CTERM sorting domain-containing protein [Chloroflexi bacterium]|nr:MAG: CGP-CTERM sorting domain-containing protein [Chloroflexota bacterium]
MLTRLDAPAAFVALALSPLFHQRRSSVLFQE